MVVKEREIARDRHSRDIRIVVERLSHLRLDPFCLSRANDGVYIQLLPPAPHVGEYSSYYLREGGNFKKKSHTKK